MRLGIHSNEGGGNGYPPLCETTAREIETAVRSLVHAAFERARSILEVNREVLDESAALLLQKEMLSREDLPRVVSPVDALGPFASLPPRATPVGPEAPALAAS